MRRLIVINGGKSGVEIGPFGMASSAKVTVQEEISTMRKPYDSSSISDSDKEEIIEMIDFGWTNDQILQMLPHIERGSIIAYRAHVTRGTYDSATRRGTQKRTVG